MTVEEGAARCVVGIDLGTTHTVVAWAPLAGDATASESGESSTALRIFPVPQLVAAGEIDARPLLPSCLYAPLDGEVTDDRFGDAPWALGAFAQARGAEVPGRLVASWKSWLCHAAVDRTAPILPWGDRGDDASGAPRIAPVDAAARVLAHVRRTWDLAFPDAPLRDQEVVLTVPASFDEASRELTLEAATRSGLTVRLLEEPQAAFYDYMHNAGSAGLAALLGTTDAGPRDEALVLVCDVGGGTTDLSLIRVARAVGDDDDDERYASDTPSVARVAVGSHLLLGGDNMDLALALACEARLVEPPGRLDPARFGQLVVACRAAKERLLANDAPSEVPVRLLAKGSSLLGRTLATSLTRDEVDAVVLDGFFPKAPRDARPHRTRGGLVAFGLPYERDVAITRHVAWFFEHHAPVGAVPTAVLLNGGVFLAPRIEERLIASLEAWGGPTLTRLPNADPDLAVARGAVAYGLARHGRGVRIGGGSARGYYVGLEGSAEVDTSTSEPKATRAVCVVPRGAEEGEPHRALGRKLSLVVGRPVRFDLFASDDSAVHAPGEIVTIDDEHFQRLPPIALAFEPKRGSGRPAAMQTVSVELEGELSPVGTLDLACVETGAASGVAPRRFRLAFQLRGATAEAPSRASVRPPSSVGGKRHDEARALVERAFAKPDDDAARRFVKDLVRDLERLLGERATWDFDVARALFDVLVTFRAQRRASPEHERVFWLLAGFCVRPGFGVPGDETRIATLASLFLEKVIHAEAPRVWQQFWIAWRRAAGGLNEATQRAIRDAVDPFLAPTEAGLKRSKKWKPDALDDMRDMAASLERVPAEQRVALGAWLVERTWTQDDPRLWAAIGRIGARVPAYASAHHVVPPEAAERWLDQLLRAKWETTPTAVVAAVQMARMSGDRARDIGPRMRGDITRRLVAVKASDDAQRAVREYVAPSEADTSAFFGEGLPVGLRLVE